MNLLVLVLAARVHAVYVTAHAAGCCVAGLAVSAIEHT